MQRFHGLVLNALAAIGLLIAATLGAAAKTYPSRPITFISPYAAGGGIDLLARLLALRLQERLGQPVVVENKPGAATGIAAASLARATPDGYTVMLATSTTMAINVAIYKSLPYDPARDLVPIAHVATSPFVLVVNPALPIHSVDELVAYAKQHPGELNYGSSGIGSFHHLSAELLATRAGITMTHIPYKATPPALNDVIAGRVQLMFGDVTSTLPQVAAGKLRALGVSTAQRSAAAPDIPTLAEVGVPGYDASAWQMIVAPSKTPKEIVGRLNAELKAIVNQADIARDINGRGSIAIATQPPDELQRYVESEIVRWSKVVEQAGATGTE